MRHGQDEGKDRRPAIARWIALCSALLLALGIGAAAQAQDQARLAEVKPAISCEALGKVDLGKAVGAPTTLQASQIVTTPKGRFCKVEGTIAPAIHFEVDLPMDHWTQRFLQNGCGALCGVTQVGITHASSCTPALNGEFVVAGDDMGHQAAMGSPQEADFGSDPQRRIDFAYRGNHLTALASKALIKAFYHQTQRYAYFVGCSDGGREALIEAQRFPDDFDGVSAGDPAALFTIQNSFYHAWTAQANKRADGTNILLSAKRQLIHDAVVAQCDTLSGVKDGLLQDPRACAFHPASIQCAPGATDTATCLTAEEVAVAERFYAGASDGKGHVYTFGAQPGSELMWSLPRSATAPAMSSGMAGRMISKIILPEISMADADTSHFAFDDANFARMAQMAPLYNAGNTNLKPFAAHGGKLILWHGLSDTSITPGVSIAYYQGVQNYVGKAQTEAFMRLFLIPGMGHCAGGDGYDQVDALSPLMGWVELQKAPNELASGKTAQRQRGPGGPDGPGGPGGPGGPNGPGGPGARPVGIPDGGGPDRSPVAQPSPPLIASRPLYAYPQIARYVSGDEKALTSYTSAMSPVALPETFPAYAQSLIGPDNQTFYQVKDGALVASVKPAL